MLAPFPACWKYLSRAWSTALPVSVSLLALGGLLPGVRSCLRHGSSRYLAVDPQPQDHPGARSDDSAFAAAACAPRDQVMTSRRTFVCALTAGLLATPFVARAQQAQKVYRVGFMFTTSPVSEMAGPEPVHPLARALVQGLRVLGYVEGQNLILERRSAEGRFERFGEIVAELVRLKVDVIVTSQPGVAATKVLTTTIPIVQAAGGDPVRAGLAQSFAHPGGNITGLTTNPGPEIEGKRLELLKAMLPGVSRIAYLSSRESKVWETPHGKNVRPAAQALSAALIPAAVCTSPDRDP